MSGDLAGASLAELVERTDLAEPFAVAHGALFQQGDVADCMYAVADGQIEILARTPGDDVVAIGRLGPGAVIGELALIDRGLRSATALATQPTRGWRLSRDAFAMCRAARRPVSTELLARLARTTCERIRARAADVAASLDGASPLRFPVRPTVDRARWRSLPTPVPDRRTAQLLPLLSTLDDAGRAALLETGAAFSVERGERLAVAGAPTQDAMIVMRGAACLSVSRGGAGERCGLAGPGRLVSTVAVMDGGPVAFDAAAREPAVVLTIPLDALARLRAAGDELAYRLDDALMFELVRELRLVTIQLARLAAHGRVATGGAA